MAVYEIEFRLQHDCPYNNLSRKYPNLVFAQWCNYAMEVLEISYKDLRIPDRPRRNPAVPDEAGR